MCTDPPGEEDERADVSLCATAPPAFADTDLEEACLATSPTPPSSSCTECAENNVESFCKAPDLSHIADRVSRELVCQVVEPFRKAPGLSHIADWGSRELVCQL